MMMASPCSAAQSHYKGFNEDITVSQAQQKCKRSGGWLASIASWRQQSEVNLAARLAGMKGLAFIGGFAVCGAQNPAYWTWLDGPLAEQTFYQYGKYIYSLGRNDVRCVIYCNWKENPVDGGLQYERYVAVDTSDTQGRWVDGMNWRGSGNPYKILPGYICQYGYNVITTTVSHTKPSTSSSLVPSATLSNVSSVSFSLSLPIPQTGTKSPPRNSSSCTSTLSTSIPITHTPSLLITESISVSASIALKHSQINKQNAALQVLGESVGETGAWIAGGVGSSSSVGAGLLTPSASMQSVRTFFVLGAAECAYNEDADLSYFEHPFQLDLGGSDTGPLLRKHAGSCLLTGLIFVFIPWTTSMLLHLFLHRRYVSEKTTSNSTTKIEEEKASSLARVQELVVTNFTAMSHGYFLPVIIKSTTLVVLHTDELRLILPCVLVTAISIIMSMHTLQCVLRRYRMEVLFERVSGNGCRSKDVGQKAVVRRWQNLQEGSYFLETYRIYFDGCRLPEHWYARCYYYVELCISCLLGVAAGIQPSSDGSSCTAVSIVMLILCVVHFVYFCGLRPLFSFIELGFAILVSLIQLTMAIVCVCSAALSGRHVELLKALGYLGVIQNAMFFIEIIVLGGWVYVRYSRRRLEALQQSASDSRSLQGTTQHSTRQEQGALQVPEEEMIVQRSNPLLKKDADAI